MGGHKFLHRGREFPIFKHFFACKPYRTKEKMVVNILLTPFILPINPKVIWGWILTAIKISEFQEFHRSAILNAKTGKENYDLVFRRGHWLGKDLNCSFYWLNRNITWYLLIKLGIVGNKHHEKVEFNPQSGDSVNTVFIAYGVLKGLWRSRDYTRTAG